MTAPTAPRCDACGGAVAFNPAPRGLRCVHCGAQRPLPASAARPEMLDLDAALAGATPTGWDAPRLERSCPGCGATTAQDPLDAQPRCAFCGAQDLTEMAGTPDPVRPTAAVPFALDRAGATERLRAFMADRSTAPSDLLSAWSVEMLRGVYLPWWLFSARASGPWTARVGTRAVREEASDRSQALDILLMRGLSWAPGEGRFDAPLPMNQTCGSRGIPADLVERVGRFDLAALEPYQPELLLGLAAERAGLSLPQAWETGRVALLKDAIWRCQGAIASDMLMDFQADLTLGETRVGHVLLPVWITTWTYGGQRYTAVVNGQTGEVAGRFPEDTVKVASAWAQAVGLLALAGLWLAGPLLLAALAFWLM